MLNRRQVIQATFLSAALAAISMPSLAATSAQAISLLKSLPEKLPGARGTFTQVTLDKNGKQTGTSSGKFAFRRPGFFSWEYLEPYKQLLIANGKQLWFYDEDLNQATVKRMDAALSSAPASLLFGTVDFDKAWTLTELPAQNGRPTVKAVPKNDPTIEAAIISFDAQGLPTLLEIEDNFGQKTQLSLEQVQQVVPSESEFNFKPPQGTDILNDQSTTPLS